MFKYLVARSLKHGVPLNDNGMLKKLSLRFFLLNTHKLTKILRHLRKNVCEVGPAEK